VIVRWGRRRTRSPAVRRGAAHSMRASAQVTAPGAITSMIVAVSTRPNRQKQNKSACSRMSVRLVHKQKCGAESGPRGGPRHGR
jgi:hypothetical protein